MTRITRTLVLAAASLGITAGAVAGAAQAASADVVDGHQVMARELTAVAKWANQQGLVGLSPASVHPFTGVARPVRPAKAARDVVADIPAPTTKYARDIFANLG
jgi:hypothetical protein